MKSFEERLGRLEEINDSINEGSVSLADAVSLFEEGISIAQSLEKELTKIERRVELLVNQPEGAEEQPNLELFPDLGPSEPSA